MAITSKWNYIKKSLLDIDFIGPQYYFECNNSSRFKSIQGSCFSFLTILTCFIIGLIVGEEIVQKSHPIVSISQEFVSFSDVVIKEFPIMFHLMTKEGVSLKLDNVSSYLETLIYIVSMDINGKVINHEKNYKLEDCNPSHYSKYSKYSNLVEKKISQRPNINYLCIIHDDEVLFSNSYFAVNSTNLNFLLKKCDNKANVCAEDLEDIVEGMTITLSYVNSFVNFYDYEKPVVTYLDELTTQISLFLSRRSYMRFVYNAFETDIGLLIDEKVRQNFIYLDSIVPDDLNLIEKGPEKNVLFWLALESPKLRNLISRSYMKIPDLLAKIGGLCNTIIILSKLVSLHYLRFLYLFSLKECAIDAVYQNSLEQSVFQNIASSKDFNKVINNNKTEGDFYTNKYKKPEFSDNSNLQNLKPKVLKDTTTEEPDDPSNNTKECKEDRSKIPQNMRLDKSYTSTNQFTNSINQFSPNKKFKIDFINKTRNDTNKNNCSISYNHSSNPDNSSYYNDESIKQMNINNHENNMHYKSININHTKHSNKNKFSLVKTNNFILSSPTKSNNARDTDNNKDINKKSNDESKTNTQELNINIDRNQILHLKHINMKNYFFTPSVVSKIVSNKINPSFCEYLISIIFCREKIKQKYIIQMKAVRKILSIQTYSKIVIAQYNHNNPCDDKEKIIY